MGPPERLVEVLREAYGIQCFVETGTYQGRTARWAATRFDRVITIEAARTWYERTSGALRALPNIEAILGDTRVELARLAPRLTTPALFWLDAHWSGGDTFGAGDECPLLEELDIVLGAPAEHLVLIDDARLFLAPPPRPHCPEQWPGIQALIASIERRRQDAYVAVLEDVVAVLPAEARPLVIQYCQDAGEALQRASRYPGLRGRVRQSLRLLAESIGVLLGRTASMPCPDHSAGERDSVRSARR